MADSGTPPLDLGAPTPEELGRTGQELALARNGDREAFERLFRRFRMVVAVFVRAQCASLNADLRSRIDAEDLMQDVLSRSWQQIDKFEYRGPGSFWAWMRRIADHEFVNRLRSEQAAARDPRRESGTAPTAHAAAHQPGPATNLASQERRERVVAALASLPERERSVIELKWFLGAAWGEIADQVGLDNADQARMFHIRYALPALQKALRHADGIAEAESDA